MKETFKRLKIFDAIIYISPDGNGLRHNVTTNNYSDREYVKKVLESKQTYVSEVLISNTTKKPSVIIAVPVLDNGQIKAIIGGTYGLDRLKSNLKKVVTVLL